MTEVHLSPEQLEQYVIGAVEGDEALSLEAHVERCAECATRLSREASLEVALFEVAQASSKVARLRPRMWASVAGATLAAAAVWLLTVYAGPPAAGAPVVVRCDDSASATRCIREANFEGVLSVGPGAAVEVPRYDEVPQKRSTP